MDLTFFIYVKSNFDYAKNITLFKGDHDVDFLTVNFTLGSFFDKFKMPTLHF